MSIVPIKMKLKENEMAITIIKSDITTLSVDIIVNAANNALCGGGGVDGAIHRAAGHSLLAKCRTLGGCETGKCKLTKAYNLPAHYIIHTVGPVWYGGGKNEETLLASCYRESLLIAEQKESSSIAFPAISCGAYRFPIERACEIAIDEIVSFLENSETEIDVILVASNDFIKREWEKAYEELENRRA